MPRIVHSDNQPLPLDVFWILDDEGKPLAGPFQDEDDAEEMLDPSCRTCGGDGREWRSTHGGNDPDVWDAGPCKRCGGSGRYRDMRPFSALL